MFPDTLDPAISSEILSIYTKGYVSCYGDEEVESHCCTNRRSYYPIHFFLVSDLIRDRKYLHD
jgi:hypothetical protein